MRSSLSSLVRPGRSDNSVRYVAIIALSISLNACSYKVALEPKTPIPSATAPLALGATVLLPPKTANHVHTVRSGLAGFANTWDIDVGEAISDYSKAFFANTITAGSDAVIQIDLISFDVRDFAARCQLQFTIRRDGRDVFQQSYNGKGLEGMRPGWFGAAPSP